MFLCAKLILSTLEDLRTESDVLRALATLPSDLEAVYAKIHQKAVGGLIFT